LALTGRAFAVNPDPLGINSHGIPVDKPEEKDAQNERVDDVDIEMPPDQPIQEVNEPPSPSLAQTRPRRIPKPNPKYSPDTYDLKYVGVNSRTRSRRSVRREEK